MRTILNDAGYLSRLSRNVAGGAGLVALAALGAPGVRAQQPAPGADVAQAPLGLPAENWRTSPHHAVIDGWGRTIPCRCRFNGKAYRLGEIVCMQTHVGTVLTRCDLFENNTSWMPSREPCVPDAGT